jgi:hypothetical protein
VQSDAKCGELYGTIFGTFPDFSAPLAAPFDVVEESKHLA